jgi:CelD/BcsL family acetyltransferase involved in cellulose biosynthesis
VEVDLVGQAETVRAALSRGMLKKEDYLRQRGRLEIRHLREIEVMRSSLAEFYAQHIARWQVKDSPSSFVDPRQRAFLECFLEIAAGTGWIRFLRIDWDGRPLAFEFAWYYRGTHYSAPWCFAIDQASRSPGHVLLRQSVLAALSEGLHSYDLGLGDQEYKLRLPARVKHCASWGLYPP